MANELISIPLATKLFQNIDESALTEAFAAQENCYVTEAGGVSRFPGLKLFADLGGSSPIYLSEFNNYMMAVNHGGETVRLDQNAVPTKILGTPVLGGRRVTFSALKDRLLMAAGSQIIAFDGEKNSVLAGNAPLATHIGSIDNFVLANEYGSDRFFYSNAGDPFTWSDLDVFAATTQPDDISAMLVTPFGEILVAGSRSVEQYERLLTGTTPFYRRWALGNGISEPYTLCFDDNAAWVLNAKYEFTRMSGQIGQSTSEDIGQTLQGIYGMSHLESHEDAWAAPMNVGGQKWLIFQSPKAMNKYGNLGVTYAIDIRASKWCELFGWDAAGFEPQIWPGVSIAKVWGKTFVGGYGKIYQADSMTYNNDGLIQRMYIRTPDYSENGIIRINRLLVWAKRGVGSNTKNPTLMMRSNQDGKGFGRWQKQSLGRAGDNQFFIQFGAQGIAHTWQFEFMVTDDCEIELRDIKADITKITR